MRTLLVLSRRGAEAREGAGSPATGTRGGSGAGMRGCVGSVFAFCYPSPRRARASSLGCAQYAAPCDGRGLERRVIFTDNTDRADFVVRLAALAEAGVFMVYAWALLPDHAHLLVRTRSRPLAWTMRSLLTGYADAFNRRHKRVGHLFQNRYRSIVVEEETYFLELVRYLH